MDIPTYRYQEEEEDEMTYHSWASKQSVFLGNEEWRIYKLKTILFIGIQE